MTTITWHIEQRNIKELKKHPKNPRTLSQVQATQLKMSLDKFGLIDKPIVNLDNTLIGGHQRVQLLRSTTSTVDCQVPDRLLSDAEVEELMLRLNRNHGEFNYDDLANNFEVPDLLDWGFSVDEMHLNLDEESDKPKKEPKVKTCPNCGHVL